MGTEQQSAVVTVQKANNYQRHQNDEANDAELKVSKVRTTEEPKEDAQRRWTAMLKKKSKTEIENAAIGKTKSDFGNYSKDTKRNMLTFCQNSSLCGTAIWKGSEWRNTESS